MSSSKVGVAPVLCMYSPEGLELTLDALDNYRVSPWSLRGR